VEKFVWVFPADEFLLYITFISIIAIAVFTYIMARKARDSRLKKASAKLQGKKVKNEKKKGKKKKRDIPYFGKDDKGSDSKRKDEDDGETNKDNKKAFDGDKSLRAKEGLIS
jgi:hypothetical protein